MLSLAVQDLIRLTLKEDLHSGDLTTDATVPAEARGVAPAFAKQRLVVCGGAVFAEAFRSLDPKLEVVQSLADGCVAEPGDELWRVSGAAAAILHAERSALNLVQRMCGVATLTHSFVEALAPGSQTRIADTRKTTPGMRELQRYAVRTGGGFNHRDNLGSAVMIKDNHIVAAGGIAAAVERARQRAPHTTKVEVEVESLEMLEEALGAGADIIMLDNFEESTQVAQAVRHCKGKALVECSGNMGLERVFELSALGVDVISVGALTHSAPAADISLRLVLE